MLDEIIANLTAQKEKLDDMSNMEPDFHIQSKYAVACGRIEDAIEYISEAQKLKSAIDYQALSEDGKRKYGEQKTNQEKGV